ncbi:glycosyl hydrolase family 28-related protein [Occultella gossypii]|uniref:Right handed beta helix domain-containing protein n=1 Tax=Occultella gossypii TaxID=2800820 RepID=A0ABS7S9N4_9MICO|nr:glycosyl hydrolase family 28-related protein [Occultella gossypii]MBZ2196827.1 hypothetical protein [Occultella gossypii]
MAVGAVAAAGSAGPAAGAAAAVPTRPHVPLAPTQVIDVRADCGAVGDGVTNDSAAFRTAAQLLEAAGGGTLVIPSGTYVVGDQFHEAGSTAPTPYYQLREVFTVEGVPVTIVGNGATLRMADGLHYGSFDPDTGEPVDMVGVDYAFRAHLGYVMLFKNCTGVVIEDLELDGNCGALVIGGATAPDIHAYGLRFEQCSDVTVTNVHTHHHALDGLSVNWHEYPADGPATPHTFTEVRSQYNGRQAFTWGGGSDIRCYRCSFSHTGRGGVTRAPNGGLDIEPNSATFGRDGYFEDCEFIDNRGPGLASALRTTTDVTFVRCVFWGTEYYSVWVDSPRFVFQDCEIYGTVPRAYGSTEEPVDATQFLGCTFEDRPWTNGAVARLGNYLFSPGGNGNGVLLEDCTLTAHQVRSVYLPDVDTTEVLRRCTFTHEWQEPASTGYLALIIGSHVAGCTFTENYPAGFTKNYTITVNAEVLAGDGDTVVSGPRVTWEGLTGVIPPGTYT